jgi:alcohol dehydrogenase
MGMFISHHSAQDLAILAGLMQDGVIRPVIDRTYPFAETADAMRYLESGRARGKVVVTMQKEGA